MSVDAFTEYREKMQGIVDKLSRDALTAGLYVVSDTSGDMTGDAEKVLRTINESRERAGLAPLPLPEGWGTPPYDDGDDPF